MRLSSGLWTSTTPEELVSRDNSTVMPMLGRLLATFSLFAALLPAAGADPVLPANPNVRLIEEIVAKVNNEIITRTEMEKMRIQIESELRLKKGLAGPELEKESKAREADAMESKIDQL